MNRKFYRLNEAPNVSAFSEYDIIHLIDTGAISAYAKLEVKSAVLYCEKRTIGTFNYNGVVKISKEDAVKVFENEKAWITHFKPVNLKAMTSFRFGPIAGLPYPNDFFEGYYDRTDTCNRADIKAVGNVFNNQKSLMVDKMNDIPELKAFKSLVSRMNDVTITPLKLLGSSLRFDIDDVEKLIPQIQFTDQNKLRELVKKVLQKKPKATIKEVWHIFRLDANADDQDATFDKEGVIIEVIGNDHLLYTNEPSNLNAPTQQASRKRVGNLISEIRKTTNH
ncbi:hypothetical protein [Thiomicrospira sp.]|uniref:hypothetical protein n=1 Tax=Thiomicrospira sp. TaxID=935 RepID=UPI002F950DBC